MLRKTIIFWIVVGFAPISYCQVTLLNYRENQNQILLTVKLDEAVLNNYEESRPGEVYLQRRNILLAIPFKEEPEVSWVIKKEKKYKKIPVINPKVSLIDSLKLYDYNPGKRRTGGTENVIVNNGFLWIDNLYCMSLDINQCSYDDHGYVTEINELEISLRFKSEVNSLAGNRDQSMIKYSESILNNTAAVNYSRKPYYEFADTTESWINYENYYCKIKTASQGIYRITYEDLSGLGIDAGSINPNSINLYRDGRRIPIYISGEEEQAFERGEFIEFIGERNMGKRHRDISEYNMPYNEYIGRYSDTTIYWLTWNETEPLRAEVSEINIIPADTLTFFREIKHYEQDNWFDYSTDQLVRREHPYWIENKTWGWHAVYPGTSTYIFILDEIAPGQQADIYTKFQSYASSLAEKAHIVALSINNSSQVYDSSYLDKYDQAVLHASLSSDLLQKDNVLKLISYPTESSVNTLFFDWYEIEYPRNLKLKDDSLIFRFSTEYGERNIKLQGLKNIQYSLWKSGSEYLRFILPDSLGNELLFSGNISAEDEFYFISEDKIRTPVLEKPKKFTNLRKQRQTDYLLITHNKFISSAREYEEFIESSYSLEVELINIEDIYDEYSFGKFNPESIRDFLKSTHQYWQEPLPKYVLLAGDGSYDYHRNKEKNLGSPRTDNFVPSFGIPVSDSWFVIWDTTGTNYPVMNIGRLPVKTEDEFYSYLNKHKKYISRKSDDWNKRYLFFSGGSGSSQEELDQLRNINQRIIDEFITPTPLGGRSVHFYKTLSPISNYGPFTSPEIVNALDSSALFISYLGHSGTQTWDNGIIDPSQLSNSKERYSLITDFGCSTGKFAEPDVQSFSELFLNKGDAIAYIGNSSLGFFSTSMIYPLIFYKNLLTDSLHCISEAHRISKLELLKTYGTSGTYSLFSLTSTFFGDPVLCLPVPAKPDLTLSRADIKLYPAFPVDDTDSVKLILKLYNLGNVSGDSLSISTEDTYSGSVIHKELRNILLPKYLEELFFNIPVRNLPGEHNLKINLDEKNKIVETYEDNNECLVKFYVSDPELRLLNTYQVESSLADTLIILNPVYSSGSGIIIELSRDENFSNPIIIKKPMDEFTTEIALKDKIEPGRWWIRGRKENENHYSFTRSFSMGTEVGFLLNDSVSFRNSELNNLKICDNKVIQDTLSTHFNVISAGFNDGKTAVISKNGETYIPAGNLIGHHVCLFRDSTFEFIDYKRFNVFGGTLETGEYYKYLDTLSSEYLVLIAVSDEGRVPDSLKRKLHEFGSIYIDSLRFRSSWALIGKRGAPGGSVPELFSNPFEGKVQIDTLIKSPQPSGYLVTSLIGPAARWEEVVLQTSAGQSDINLFPVLFDTDGKSDTLHNIFSGNSRINILELDAGKYRYIKLKLEMKGSTGGNISSIGVNYAGPAELVTNNQQSFILKDTLDSGDENTLYLKIYNAGESSSGNFNVLGEIINPDLTRDTLFLKNIPSIDAGDDTGFDTSFHAINPGAYIIDIKLDSDNNIRELYEDNNILQIPFFVNKTEIFPSAKIFFDGSEVYDGDYVSSTPEVRIRIAGYPLKDDDTLFVKVYLDNNIIPYSVMNSIRTSSETDLIFKPFLEYGEHELRISFRDSLGSYNGAGGKTLMVMVERDNQLLSVYNYPNPFSNDTYFTFRLTSLPDELQINIYTIAGRLLRKIILSSQDLKADFNSIYWDGRDEDGDSVANGVYFYKIIIKKGDKTNSVIQKMAKIGK